MEHGLSNFVLREMSLLLNDPEFGHSTKDTPTICRLMEPNQWQTNDWSCTSVKSFKSDAKFDEGSYFQQKLEAADEVLEEVKIPPHLEPSVDFVEEVKDLTPQTTPETHEMEEDNSPTHKKEDSKNSIQKSSSASNATEEERVSQVPHRRKDVIIKSILRCMRRYFCHQLETLTSFNKKEKDLVTKQRALITACHQLVSHFCLSQGTSNMAFYLAMIAYPCDMRKLLTDSKATHRSKLAVLNQTINILNLIENAMNRFSMKVFTNFMEIPEISFLFQHFLEHGDLSGSLENDGKCLELLVQKSHEVVDAFQQKAASKRRSIYVLKTPFFLFTQNKGTKCDSQKSIT